MYRILVILLAAGPAWAQAEPSATIARRTLAELAKISLEPPSVEVQLHETKLEDGLRIEDVSWEGLDGERAPAFVIRPEAGGGPLPAIICLHGSSGSRESMSTKEFGPGEWVRHGAAEPHTRMMGWARELARRGYVALALTQRGLDRRGPPINTQANVLLVQNRTAMGAVLHEIRQAVTYLSERPDVDAARIAATGMSFGGITSFYAWALDDRIAAAAPICGGVGSVAAFARLGRLSYHGTYWWLPGMLAKGDHAEFTAAIAPRPLLLWAPTEDIGMPREGVDEFVSKVRPVYERLGADAAFVVIQQPGEHAFTVEAFEAMVNFFDDQL